METGNFWIILMEFLPFFQFYRIFLGNCANNLGKYGHMHLYGVRGPEPIEFEKTVLENPMETSNYFENFHEF